MIKPFIYVSADNSTVNAVEYLTALREGMESSMEELTVKEARELAWPMAVTKDLIQWHKDYELAYSQKAPPAKDITDYETSKLD